MREIKFRAFSYLDKIFYYWDYDGSNYPWGIAGGVSEPCQFTGLIDKNGHGIYEGDIVTTHHFYDWGDEEGFDVIQIVKWCSFHVGWRGFTAKMLNNPKLAGNGLSGPITIIGNIFESPELLK